jgi:hypothetical protein
VQRLSRPLRSIGPLPPGWGSDQLSGLLETGLKNAFATFHNHKPIYQRLSDIWDAYAAFTANFVDPSDFAGDGISVEGATFAAFFFTRSQSAFLAGANLATAAQVGDVNAPLRTSLEWALYAYQFAHDPKKLEAWLARSDGQKERDRAKSASQIKPMIVKLEQDHADLGAIARSLYESLIDFGAHPNDLGMFGNMTMDDVDAGKRYMSLIYTADDLSTRVALKTAARVGLTDLFIAKTLFQRRFDELGLSQRLAELSEGL